MHALTQSVAKTMYSGQIMYAAAGQMMHNMTVEKDSTVLYCPLLSSSPSVGGSKGDKWLESRNKAEYSARVCVWVWLGWVAVSKSEHKHLREANTLTFQIWTTSGKRKTESYGQRVEEAELPPPSQWSAAFFLHHPPFHL